MIEWAVLRVAEPGLMWAHYAKDFGEERLREVFGAHWPPPGARPGEEVWAFREPIATGGPYDPADRPTGWLSLAVDQFDPAIVHMSRGVWPGEHGRGLGRFMLGWAEARARRIGGLFLDIEVHRANARHLAKIIRDPYWRLVAERFEPAALCFRHDL